MLRALLRNVPAGAFGVGVAGKEQPITPVGGIGITVGPVNAKPLLNSPVTLSATISRPTNVGAVSFSWKLVAVPLNSFDASDFVGGLIDTTATIPDGFYAVTVTFQLAAKAPPTVARSGKLVIYNPVGTTIVGTSELGFSILPEAVVNPPPTDPDIFFKTSPAFVTVDPNAQVSTHVRFERAGNLNVVSSVRRTIQGTGSNPLTDSSGAPLFQQGTITFPAGTNFYEEDILFPAQDPPASRATANYALDTFVRCSPVGAMAFDFGVNARPARPGNNPSGLPWLSGWTAADGSTTDRFAAWRGRALDMHYLPSNRKGTFADLVGSMSAAFRVNQYAVAYARGMWVQQTVPLFPSKAELGGYATQFAACAAGLYDDYHSSMIRTLRAYPRNGKLIVRLGRECGADQADSYPLDPSNQKADYRAGWARIADLWHKGFVGYGGCLMDWNNIRTGAQPVDTAYPGDSYVDIISVDLYGNKGAGHINSFADFDKYAARGSKTNPAGPQTWADYADSHGKKFAVPEWAPTSYSPYTDDLIYDHPYYIEGMWNLFNDLGDLFFYESFFNHVDDAGNDHIIYPANNSRVPNASAKYQTLWTPT